MPYSSHEGKQWLDLAYRRINPLTVVDVGAGSGTYVDYLRRGKQGHWTAIEAWAPYIRKFHLRKKYDVVTIGDVREVELPEADLYIAGDVLEHMERDEAVALIERIKAKAKHLFVSVPIIEIPQDAVGGNPFEEHKYHWGFDEMNDVLRGDGTLTNWKGAVIGAFYWKAPNN